MFLCTLNWRPLQFMVKSEYFPVRKMFFIAPEFGPEIFNLHDSIAC